MRLKIYVDASPSKMAYVTEDKNRYQFEMFTLPQTNNTAEYQAIILALTENSGDLDILSDSQLVIRQLNLEYSIKDDNLRILAQKVHDLCKGRVVSFTWIPRKDNLAGKYLG